MILNSLPAGTHLLSIRGGDNKGNWSENEIQLKLKVNAFFYQQIWFLILQIVVILIGAFAFIKTLKVKIDDATRQLQAHNEIIEKQSEELMKLDHAKSDFFTNITHEFRTPLTVIQGIVQLIQKGKVKSLTTAFNDIEHNSKQLLHMINQILDLRKLESNKMQLDLSQSDVILYVDYMVNSHQYLAQQKDIDLSFSTTEEHVLMDFDSEKLKIVLTNLISNAIKYTHTGGHIRGLCYKK